MGPLSTTEIEEQEIFWMKQAQQGVEATDNYERPTTTEFTAKQQGVEATDNYERPTTTEFTAKQQRGFWVSWKDTEAVPSVCT